MPQQPPTKLRTRLAGLWSIMAGYRLIFGLATGCLAISAAAKAGSYMLLRYFIDDVLAQNNAGMTVVSLAAAGFVGLAVAEGGFTYLSGRLAAYTAENVVRRLRGDLFDHIQRLSFSYHDQMRTGELVQRASSDVDAIRRFFSEQATGMGRILMLFSINLIVLLSLNTTLALLSIIVVPILVGLSIFFFKRISNAYESMQAQDGIMSTTLQENLAAVRVVKAFARQDYECERFEADSREMLHRGQHLIRQHSLFWPISDTLCGLQMLIGIAVGAAMTLNQTISVGTFIAYTGMIVWLIWPMRNLGRLIVQMSTALVSYGRVAEVLSEEQEPLDAGVTPQHPLRGAIAFEQVGFAYQDTQPVLRDLSFEVRPGQVIGLVGPTGSGKSSLVSLLPRFYEYTSGRILLDDQELTSYSRRYLRSQIGIVAQEPFLFSRTIRENITYGIGREVSDEQVVAAARAAQAHDFIVNFPDGYDTIVGEKGVTLSGGQKQRLTIARTLLKNPRILILDDSTSSVDTETEARIRQALKTLMLDRTTFIIAHRIQSVADADLILVLDDGRIVQRGTHAELVSQPGIYQKLYELQEQIELELEKEIADVELLR